VKLQRRVTLAAAAVIAVVGTTVGFASVFNNYLQAVSRIDQRLNANSVILSKASENALATALLLGSQTDIPVTVAYVTRAGELTVLVESSYAITKSPGLLFLKQSTDSSGPGPGTAAARWRSVPIGDGDYVIFASSSKQVRDQRNAQLRWLFFLLILAISMGVFAVNRLIRRDIRQIEHLAAQSTLIAAGDTAVKLPAGQGNSEIDELSNSLGLMVENLRSSIERERRIHESMQDFLGDASHELRTPLTSIRGYTEILAGTVSEPSEQQARAFSRIVSEISRMDTLISDLLLLAELGESKPLTSESVNLTELLNLQVADLYELQPARPIEYSADSNVYVQGSRELFIRLLSNIFSNIRRHTAQTDLVKVSLTLDWQEAVLIVADSGPGLADKFYDQQEVNPFMRFDPSRARSTGGSGLGLSIINAIVDSHSGQIYLERSELGGHKTIIRLPATGLE